MTAPRKRRSATEARRRILETAERHLVDGGPEAVRVQVIARDLGITDAAIHYHFGSREQLLEELLRHGGRKLREAVRAAVADNVDGRLDLPGFLADANAIFRDLGYSRLALWLRAAGWRERGSGMFDGLVDAIHDTPAIRSHREAQRIAALLVLVLMAEPVYGEAARRSVSMRATGADAEEFDLFVRDTFAGLLE